MKIIILGAGEVGKQLTFMLQSKDNDISIVDISSSKLTKIRDKFDILTVSGNSATVDTLNSAGVKEADLLIATTGDDASNIISCQIAKHFGVKNTICRLSSGSYFSEKLGYIPTNIGIDHITFPISECIDKILSVLEHRLIVESIKFSIPNIRLTAVKVPKFSDICGSRILDFPSGNLLSKIRFSAIIRNQRLIMPTGSTIIAAEDEIYVSGKKSDIQRFINIIDDGSKPKKLVIIAGATTIGIELAKALVENDFTVRIIEKEEKRGEFALNSVQDSIMVITGDATDSDVLLEAGIEACDAFVTTSIDDEENILSCILAKKIGAEKVVTVTNKAEYVDIIPGISAINCGFSPRIAAVNAVLRILGNETGRVNAILQRVTDTYVYELHVRENSKVVGKKIQDFEGMLNSVISMVIRGGEVVPATGCLELQAADKIITVSTPKLIKELEPIFKKKQIFSL